MNTINHPVLSSSSSSTAAALYNDQREPRRKEDDHLNELLLMIPSNRRPVPAVNVRASDSFYDTAVLEKNITNFLNKLITLCDQPNADVSIIKRECTIFKSQLEKDKLIFLSPNNKQ